MASGVSSGYSMILVRVVLGTRETTNVRQYHFLHRSFDVNDGSGIYIAHF